MVTFGEDGEMAAWFESLMFERPTLTIERISGEAVVERTLRFGDTFPLALSERWRRVAFWLDSQGRGSPFRLGKRISAGGRLTTNPAPRSIGRTSLA